MATIHTDRKTITQINVFEVDPANQDELVELLIEAVRCVCTMPGWISASIHKSLDGTRVTNYALATDQSAWELIIGKLRDEGYFDKFRKLSKPNPCLYHCMFSLSSD